MRYFTELFSFLSFEDLKIYLITFGLNENDNKLMEFLTYSEVTYKCERIIYIRTQDC